MIKRILFKVWFWQRERLFRKKRKQIARTSGFHKPEKTIAAEYYQLWKPLCKSASILYPGIYAKTSGLVSSVYTPENVYYNSIELILNNKAFTSAYADKNFYEEHLPQFRDVFPDTILRGINRALYDNNYHQINDVKVLSEIIPEGIPCILKPSIETSGGANLSIMERNGNDYLINNKSLSLSNFVSFLNNQYALSFVLQEKITQHPWFAAFNKSSVNTIRLFTYRSVKSNIIYPLHTIIRFGKEGSLVDNQAAGGLSCGIDSNGCLKYFAVDKYGKRYENIPAVKERAGENVPALDRMKELAIKIAPKYPYHRLMGFDFCLDANNQVRLLEINCKNIETNFLQMNNGPLFGDFTKEIVDYCIQNKRSIVFDFTI